MTGTTTLEHVVEIEASPSVVYDLWITAAGISAWWGTVVSVDPKPGGVIEVRMDNGAVMSGQFELLERPQRIVFTFGWQSGAPDGPLPPGSTRVDVSIDPTSTGTLLTLRHSGLPVEHIGSHAEGWAHFVGVQLPSAASNREAGN